MTRITHSRPARSTRSLRSAALRAAAVALALGIALLSLTLTGCGSTTAEKPASTSGSAAAAFPVTITDDASRTVTMKSEPQRIVSLAPANTEIAFALGLGDKVVGVTTYDDYPAEVTSIAKVGDFASPNLEAIAAAKPDLVLATSGVQAEMVAKLQALGATVVVIDPQNIAGVYADIERVGKVTGATAPADKLIAGMKADVAAVRSAVSTAAPVTAFVEIGQNPLFTVGKGTLIDELVALAGGTNVVTQPGYVAYSSEQLIAADPQVYLATKGSMSDPNALKSRAGFSKLAAVKNDRIVILDDNLVSRPGPRFVQGLKQIAEGLHPDAFAAK
ncbi:MAG: cobalamin-binding protein [Coriobacteriia bacterium]